MNQHSKKIRTKHEEDEGELYNYTSEKLLSFPTKVNNNNNNNNNKKTKHLVECNCWVCKILDSSSTSVTNNEIDTTTKRYEPYNIVSETGDSIFYDPFLSNIFNDNDDKLAGEIYVSEGAVEEVVNRIIDHHHQERLGPSVNNNKNEY
jgi:hypothetical protein